MINNLGVFIRQLRGNVSLREFAKNIGISHTHLDTIEKGIDFRTGKRVSITLDTLGRLAIALNTPLIDLLRFAANDNLIPKESFYVNPSPANLSLTDEDINILKKYRALTPMGKKTVEAVLNVQYELVAPKTEDAAM